MQDSKQVYEWGIVGGGPHGVSMAGALMKTGLTPEDVVMVDSGSAPLWSWRRRVANCGMIHLRSDVRYHLDCWPKCVPYTLTEWAGPEWPHDQHIFLLDEAADHRVASIRLFDAHCDWFIEQHQLEQTWRQGFVQKLVRNTEGGFWELQLAGGETINAKQVALATGSFKLNYPAWAASLKGVYHLLDLGVNKPDFSNLKHVTVIGAGLSSANFVLDLYRNTNPTPEITLLNRGQVKTSILEANLSSLEPPFQKEFLESGYTRRRAMILEARVNGSIPPLTYQRLLNTDVQIVQGEVKEAREVDTGLELELTNGERLYTQAVVLGTGFARGSAQFSLVNQLARDYKLPLWESGLPMPGHHLEWMEGLFLMGGAAELELGPISRNIAGAGQAISRILPDAGLQEKWKLSVEEFVKNPPGFGLTPNDC